MRLFARARAQLMQISLVIVVTIATVFAFAKNPAPPPSIQPPGADPDRGPSTVIFPPQSVPLKFDHKLHVRDLGQACTSCHPGGTTSARSSDVILPKGSACDSCHGSDHRDTFAVKMNAGAKAVCSTCHEGSGGDNVPRVRIPEPNLVFSHKAHATRNIGCPQCHGDVSAVGLATRDQLPRMRGCVKCHALDDTPSVARGDAQGGCETCHLSGAAKEGGKLRTLFGSGKMLPPKWLHNAGHDVGFIQRHKFVAANDSKFCANCHKEEYCTDCHDGRVRPRNIHPGDYLSMHATEARMQTQNCTSCHREQSFCLSCHQRLGVAMSGPASVRELGRFHPPKNIWSGASGGSGGNGGARGARTEHSREAMRNLNACVSCHIERDCVVCHGGKGVGGGFSPHPPDFAGRCGVLFNRNPRPCLVCHETDSAEVSRCR